MSPLVGVLHHFFLPSEELSNDQFTVTPRLEIIGNRPKVRTLRVENR